MEYDIVGLIQNVGFPIVVCLYFMLRFEKILKSNTEALNAILEKLKGGK